MKYRKTLILGFVILSSVNLLIACKRQNNVCPSVDPTPQPKPALVDLIAQPLPNDPESPIILEIGGQSMTVDKLVDYPLCNDKWRGTVYVSCDVIVGKSTMDSDKNPLFLKGCNLEIESGTIVYVAAHNDAAYYKGCSCHTGEDPIQ